jgi:hypothetical protein
VFDAITKIGSIVGLLSGIFLVYDRLARGRPIASLTILMDGTRKIPCVRIDNITPYDVAITNTEVRPKTYFLVEDLDVRRVVRGAAGKSPYFMLKAGDSKELKIAPMFKDGQPLEVTPHRVRFLLYWRRGNATWMPQIPIFVRTSTDIIRKYGLEEENR